MLKVGLTGGIGSGKTYIAEIFIKLGIPVYFADQEAKQIIHSEKEVKNAIIRTFGIESYINDKYNTKYIAKLVFSSKDLLKKLNQIVHPYLIDNFTDWCAKHTKNPYVILEAAILFESNLASNLDKSILVDSPEELRIRRVMERDQITHEEVLKRIENQMPADKLRSLADWVIENKDKKLILPQLLKIHHQLIRISETHG